MQLIEANDDQKRARDALNYDAWGMLLTGAEYAAREARLRAHAWSKGALRSWILLGQRDEPLASCETYQMRSYAHGAVGWTWAVASVFTERRLRGQGHASVMMKLLGKRLRELDSGAHAVVLYSDVGASMYERAGFVTAASARDRIWPAERGEPRAEILDEPIDLAPPSDPFVVWPTPEQLDWHRERERAYAALLGRAPFASFGARDGDGVIFWTPGFRNDRLLVLNWNGRNLASLVRTAQNVAAKAGFARVVMWDRPGAEGGTIEAREGSLPMIAPIDPRVRPDDWKTTLRGAWV
jgi:hypothetical protein